MGSNNIVAPHLSKLPVKNMTNDHWIHSLLVFGFSQLCGGGNQEFKVCGLVLRIIDVEVLIINRMIVYELYTVLKSCYYPTTVNGEKQSVEYSIIIYLFLFLKHNQFSCLKLVIRLVNIAIML